MDNQFTSDDIHNKPASAVMDDLMRQSEAALESGARATAELHELKRRAGEALDWRKQLNQHSWALLGAAAGAAIPIFLIFRRHR